MDPMSSPYGVPSPYDQQVPSTSSATCAMARPNTPQTPYARSAYSSAHASPFRPANAADAVRLRETCARNAQTAQWMDSQYLAGVSGYHGSGVQSGPCSVMSAASGGMSVMSGMSQMSLGNMSQLSICTQLTEAHYAQVPHYQPTSGASSMENIDPSNIYEINRQVNTLIVSLRHDDPVRNSAESSELGPEHGTTTTIGDGIQPGYTARIDLLLSAICVGTHYRTSLIILSLLGLLSRLQPFCVRKICERSEECAESAKYGIEFVRLEGVQIFGNLLSHGSTMLLHELLHCLAAVGDLKEALESQDITSTIISVLQLMGAHDPILVNHGTAFLLNVSANSVRNKTTMVAERAPDTLLSVLNHRNNYLTIPLPNVRQLIVSITDNVLICLANLTRNQDECGRNACVQIARKSDSAKTLLNVLASGSVECQNRVLMVIFNTNLCVSEYKLFFVDTVDDYNQSNLITFILRLLWNNFAQFNNFADSERIHRRKQIDRVLRLLATLSKSDDLLEQIATIFREHNPLPLLRPFRNNDFTAHRDFLEFLDALSNDPKRFPLVHKWLSTADSQQILHYYCQFQLDAKLSKLTFLTELSLAHSCGACVHIGVPVCFRSTI
ncbi:unnamed protein product [Strongylus vulgaris]|uniref:Armadillo repeat-containing domain-containing protein n=1 Tax=Strongylus vulgaris TaxID=40348 RepID=A0A3P7LDM1_STRVU|nr:unnamed protein product [Strongylus vulgaris]